MRVYNPESPKIKMMNQPQPQNSTSRPLSKQSQQRIIFDTYYNQQGHGQSGSQISQRQSNSNNSSYIRPESLPKNVSFHYGQQPKSGPVAELVYPPPLPSNSQQRHHLENNIFQRSAVNNNFQPLPSAQNQQQIQPLIIPKSGHKAIFTSNQNNTQMPQRPLSNDSAIRKSHITYVSQNERTMRQQQPQKQNFHSEKVQPRQHIEGNIVLGGSGVEDQRVKWTDHQRQRQQQRQRTMSSQSSQNKKSTYVSQKERQERGRARQKSGHSSQSQMARMMQNNNQQIRLKVAGEKVPSKIQQESAYRARAMSHQQNSNGSAPKMHQNHGSRNPSSSLSSVYSSQLQQQQIKRTAQQYNQTQQQRERQKLNESLRQGSAAAVYDQYQDRSRTNSIESSSGRYSSRSSTKVIIETVKRKDPVTGRPIGQPLEHKHRVETEYHIRPNYYRVQGEKINPNIRIQQRKQGPLLSGGYGKNSSHLTYSASGIEKIDSKLVPVGAESRWNLQKEPPTIRHNRPQNYGQNSQQMSLMPNHIIVNHNYHEPGSLYFADKTIDEQMAELKRSLYDRRWQAKEQLEQMDDQNKKVQFEDNSNEYQGNEANESKSVINRKNSQEGRQRGINKDHILKKVVRFQDSVHGQHNSKVTNDPDGQLGLNTAEKEKAGKYSEVFQYQVRNSGSFANSNGAPGVEPGSYYKNLFPKNSQLHESHITEEESEQVSAGSHLASHKKASYDSSKDHIQNQRLSYSGYGVDLTKDYGYGSHYKNDEERKSSFEKFKAEFNHKSGNRQNNHISATKHNYFNSQQQYSQPHEKITTTRITKVDKKNTANTDNELFEEYYAVSHRLVDEIFKNQTNKAIIRLRSIDSAKMQKYSQESKRQARNRSRRNHARNFTVQCQGACY